jgi:hypothetical protein
VNRTRSLAALLAALFVSGAALAQTVVGRSIVDGKVALLYDDMTWALEAPAAGGTANCDAVTTRVQFCGQALGWTSSRPGTSDVNAAYEIDPRHYAQYIIEEVGIDDGMNSEFMRRIVLENAKNFSGTDAEIITVEPVMLGDLSGETIVYRVNINGAGFVFANSVFVDSGLTMQIMTFALATDYAPEHAKMQTDLLAATKVTE